MVSRNFADSRGDRPRLRAGPVHPRTPVSRPSNDPLRRKFISRKVAFAVAAAGLLAAGQAHAVTQAGSFQVSATVLPACSSVTAAAVNFGNVGTTIVNNINQQSAVTVSCTVGTNYQMGVSSGLNSSISTGRNMTASGTPATIAYHVYTTSSYGTEYDDITGGHGANIGSNIVTTSSATGTDYYTLWLQIPPQTLSNIGAIPSQGFAFSDTLYVDLSF